MEDVEDAAWRERRCSAVALTPGAGCRLRSHRRAGRVNGANTFSECTRLGQRQQFLLLRAHLLHTLPRPQQGPADAAGQPPPHAELGEALREAHRRRAGRAWPGSSESRRVSAGCAPGLPGGGVCRGRAGTGRGGWRRGRWGCGRGAGWPEASAPPGSSRLALRGESPRVAAAFFPEHRAAAARCAGAAPGSHSWPRRSGSRCSASRKVSPSPVPLRAAGGFGTKPYALSLFKWVRASPFASDRRVGHVGFPRGPWKRLSSGAGED